MKLPLLALAISGAALAAAQYPSFDMLYVTDRGDRSIKRFDGRTGTYFGAFGSDVLTAPRGLVMQPGTTRILVADDLDGANFGMLRHFNAFTGDLITSTYLDFDPTGVTMIGAEVFVAGSRLDGTGVIASSTISTNFFMDRTLAAPARYFDIYNFGSLAFTEAFSGGYGSLNSSTLGINFRNDTGQPSLRGYGQVYAANSVTADIVRGDGGGLVFNGGIPGVTNIVDLDAGHNFTFVTGKNPANSAQGMIAKFDAIGRRTTLTFGSQYLIDPTYIDVVPAPEPATMLALAGGAALLLRRRKPRR